MRLWLRALIALAYTFGFRKGELLGMRCEQVDLLNNKISLYSGETKNDEGRGVVLTNECRALVTELRKGKQPEDFLFTRQDGRPVIDFRGEWDALVVAAGLPGLIFHDFRRSAVRNMLRRGIAQKTAMKISGHKTDSIFSRYNIVSEDDITDAARKIEAGAKAAMQPTAETVTDSSLTVAQDCSTKKKGEKARKTVQSVS